MRPHSRRSRAFVALALLAVIAAGGFAAYEKLAPERSTRVDEALPAEAAALRTLAGGEWRDGEPLHHASGTVRVLEDGAGARFLRFEGYEATAGPDVYFYLVRDPGASTVDQVEREGLRVVVAGGAEDGQATLRGTFNVPLPDAWDLATYPGIVAWCEAYNVLFGKAELQA